MRTIPVRTLLAAGIILLSLVAVVITATILDRRNSTAEPIFTPSSSTAPSSANSDIIEGSMGLGENPFK